MVHDATDRSTQEAGATPRSAPPRPRRCTHGILGDDPSTRLLDPDLSWLQFNERVLASAEDPAVPLLERVRYLAMAATNLDESHRLRVTTWRPQPSGGGTEHRPPGPEPRSRRISAYLASLLTEHTAVFRDVLDPALRTAGIDLCRWADLPAERRTWLTAHFEERVRPLLPAPEPGGGPATSPDRSLNLAVLVRRTGTDALEHVRVTVPSELPRFVALPGGTCFLRLEHVIAAHLEQLLPGREIVGRHVFRVTRVAGPVVTAEVPDDLLTAVEDQLAQHSAARPVRLEVEDSTPGPLVDELRRAFSVGPSDVHRIRGPLDLSRLEELHGLDRPDLRYPAFEPFVPPALAGGTVDPFAVIRRGDVLVHHPYEDFTASTAAFLRHAAGDPDVVAIGQTLYRTSEPTNPVIEALLTAAAAGKHVVAVIELRADLDERANIGWARVLERAGVHVTYGLTGAKTHAKVALVVRDEGGGPRRYAHIGTGNYNDRTARTYEDVGLLTADPQLGEDLSDLFDVLTGGSPERSYRRLLVAPATLLDRLLELIAREAHAPDGHIVAKVNALTDADVVEALYGAARSGTRIELIVRGSCALRPGVPGLSETIHVRSLIGRYLEHSRILRFGSDARGLDYLVGSADLTERNLRDRIEAVTPVEDPVACARLDEILQVALADDQLAWVLGPDAVWRRIQDGTGFETHRELQERARTRSRR